MRQNYRIRPLTPLSITLRATDFVLSDLYFPNKYYTEFLPELQIGRTYTLPW